jgi:hypothetical protein
MLLLLRLRPLSVVTLKRFSCQGGSPVEEGSPVKEDLLSRRVPLSRRIS